MRSVTSALVLGLSFVSLANASDGRIVVACGETHFSDLTKIVIQETDLKGQYQIVETVRDFAAKKDVVRLSPVFGEAEIEKSEFPNLTPWNGYTRKLVRFGRDNYLLTIEDECSQASLSIDCRDSF